METRLTSGLNRSICLLAHLKMKRTSEVSSELWWAVDIVVWWCYFQPVIILGSRAAMVTGGYHVLIYTGSIIEGERERERNKQLC